MGNGYLFATHHLFAVLREQLRNALEEIENTAEDYILNVSESDFPPYVVSKYEIAVPELGEAHRLDTREVNVSTAGDMRWGGQTTVRGVRIEIRIPFTGHGLLFHCQPSSFTTNPPHGYIHQNEYIELIFDYAGELDPQRVNSDLDHVLGEIRRYLAWIRTECHQFNAELSTQVFRSFANRKERLLKNRSAAAAIKIPLIVRQDSPRTYAVPNVRRKPEIHKPIVKEKGFKPEPTLLEQEYENILTIIRGMVGVMERSPKAFVHMGEEDMRTQFLVQLNGQYQGRATGETFNYKGKTDILIREGDRNVFIAECKIWKGEEELLKAINQILGYLHWRDTKSALLVFNRNKSFSEVLAKVGPTVQSHTCCKKLLKKVGETEWRFVFRNPDDANRELYLAVMLFDVPKEGAA